MFALVAAGCGPRPERESEERLSQTVVGDGVAVTVGLDQAAVRQGESVGIVLAVHNRGRDPIVWRGDGCTLSAPITVAPAAAGTVEMTADDPLATLLAELTAGAEIPTQVSRLPAEPRDAGASCHVDHGFSLLAPGRALRYEAVWSATTVLGAPVGPGAYLVVAEFPKLRPGVPIDPAGYRAARDSQPIRVELPLRAVADERGDAGLSARAAAERLVSLPELAALAGGREVWTTARLVYRNRGWELRVPVGGRQVLVAMVADSAFSTPVLRREPAP